MFAAAGVVAYVLSGVPAAWFWRAFRPLLWLVALTFVAQVLFAPGEAFYSVWIFHFSWQGLEFAAFLSLRLLVLVLIGSVLTLTTPPLALTDGLAWLGRPLRRLRVPTDELALMVTIALRFIPTLLVEVDQIMRAQRARGADFGSGGPDQARQSAGARTHAAVRAELPARRRARAGHGGALLPSGDRAHAAAPAQGRRRRRGASRRRPRPSSSPGCSCRMPA